MKEMKCVYVAGPYRANGSYQLEKNVRIAEDASYGVYGLGAVAICPHTQTRYFNGELTEQFWIDATMNMLARCDAMLVVEGWQKSSGTLGEIKYAAENDIPTFYSLEELEGWLYPVEKAGA